MAAMYAATFRLLEGDTADCEAIFGQIRQGYQMRLPIMMAWVDAREAWLCLHQGNLGAARALLADLSGATQAASRGLIGVETAASRGWLAWEEGRFEDASELLASACSGSVLDTYRATAPGLVFLALRVDALMRLGHAEQAAAAIACGAGTDQPGYRATTVPEPPDRRQSRLPHLDEAGILGKIPDRGLGCATRYD